MGPGERFAPRVAKTVVWLVFSVMFLIGSLCALTSGAAGWKQAFSVAAMFVGSTLLILRPKWNWVGLAAAAVAIGAVPFVLNHPPYHPFYDFTLFTAGSVMIGLVVYGLTTLANAVQAMDAARTQLARMAVQAERTRFARDLHDLLGYSLSAISLKSELTHRLVDKNPARAQEELVQIMQISRQALADVRSVANGYRELSLEEEALSARSVLAAAEVDVRMDIDLDPDELATGVRNVLATVLREAVTNILRHSKAERCEVVMRQSATAVLIEIVNDGLNGDSNDAGGSGIRNLSTRVAGLDGTLVAGVNGDGRYRLKATIPTDA